MQKDTVNLIATGMLVITTGSFLRAAYDHVGWKIWTLLAAASEVQQSFAEEFFFNFLFLNGLVIGYVWAILPALQKFAAWLHSCE